MSRLYKTCFFGFVVGLLGVVLSFFPVIHQWEEDAGLDLLFKLRGPRKPPAGVVVVSIGREAAERLNISENPDQWPRSLHARLTETLARKGASVIVFDVYFTEPRTPKEDHALAAALKNAGNVVLAERLRAKELAASQGGDSYAGVHKIVTPKKPIPVLSQSAFATAPFVLPSFPVKLNQYWTFQTAAGDVPTFPVVAFQLYALPVYKDFVDLLETASPPQTGKVPRDALQAIQIKGATRFIKDIRAVFENDPSIATKMLKQLEDTRDAKKRDKTRLLKSLIEMYSGPNQRYLNYYGPPRTIQTVPYLEALQAATDGIADHVDFKDKIVFVGLSEKTLTEKDDTFHTVFTQPNGVFISGVEIAATAFSNLLEGKVIDPISSYRYVLILLGWGFLVGGICLTMGTVMAAVAVMTLAVFYFIGAEQQFKTADIWYPVIVPLFMQTPFAYFGAVLWNYFETNKERRNIRTALSYYVPDELVNELARNRIDIKRAGQTVYGACLFTDAAGYTTVSEAMRPREVADLMYKYFEATFEPIKKNHGIIVDLKGDSILAIWKAQRAELALRRQACIAALGVADAVRKFNQSFQNLRLPTRVGLHAGEIFLGNVGAGDHYEYGPTGDTVNTASRLETLNKHLGTEILVSEEVIHNLDNFLSREVGIFRLKGKAHALVVHELICHMDACDQRQKEACAIFAQALRAFKSRCWDEAEEKFQRAIEAFQDDQLSRFYLHLCAHHKQQPPEEPWEGVIFMEEK